MSIQLTKNFRSHEFRCRCGCGQVFMDVRFMVLLQKMRENYGKPINPTSGWRCIKHNSDVGGAKNSFHMQGQACDMAYNYADELYRLIEAALDAGLNGIVLYKNKKQIHVDNRNVEMMLIK